MGMNRKPSGARIRGVGTHRASQPSGQWLDDYGNPAPSPNATYEVQAAYKAAAKPPEGNPNPDNYKVVKAKELHGYLILQLNYPDCTNYEGNKILVFQGVTLIDLVNQRKIDPHFFKHSLYKSPIARFEPTDIGWAMAETFVAAWAVVRTR